MPSPSYAQNKQHIMKWREHNYERKKELDRIHQNRRNIWKKIKIEFLQILII